MALELPDNPFQQLLVYANRSVALARGLPQQIEIVPEWSGIAFELAGVTLVAPMGEVTEILTLPSFTRLPSVQDWVRGIANVRGRLLPMIDMEAFLGGQLGRERVLHRVMVLEIGDFYTGMIVNSVSGMETFAVDTFRAEKEDNIPDVLAPYVVGSYELDGKRYSVFSPERLVQDERFSNVAA